MTHKHVWVAHQRILGEGNVPLMIEACACGQTRVRQMEPPETVNYLLWRRQVAGQGEQFLVR